MHSSHGKMRKNVEEGDRLSSLPDDLIHKILSFVGTREAISTSVLSSRWRFIWTSLPHLDFSYNDFDTLPMFSEYVTNVLSRRDNLTDLYSMKLRIHVKESDDQKFVKRILEYAFSHNIQQLNLEGVIEFPLSLFSSKSLKHLSLKMHGQSVLIGGGHGHLYCYLTSTWELPTLTTLVLKSVVLCDDEAEKCVGVFSKCPNLQNLTLTEFKTKGLKGFSIVHPRLSNLTLKWGLYTRDIVKVVAPQLKNLTIKFCLGEHVVSAPKLASLAYDGCRPLRLSTKGFHSLEKANICISSPKHEDVHQIVSLFQLLHNVKFLTLNLEIVEILSSSMDLILQQPSPFVNLTSLKIYPKDLDYWMDEKAIIMSTELKSYLLDGSPNTTFTMLLRQEVKARKIMAELGVILAKEKEEDNTNKINMTTLERGEADVGESRKLKAGRNMERIKSCWENLGVQLQQRKEKACLVISKLQDIEELLSMLPASKKDEIQPCFSSLCAEAEIAISQITEQMKIQCSENQSLSTLFFQKRNRNLKRNRRQKRN